MTYIKQIALSLCLKTPFRGSHLVTLWASSGSTIPCLTWGLKVSLQGGDFEVVLPSKDAAGRLLGNGVCHPSFWVGRSQGCFRILAWHLCPPGTHITHTHTHNTFDAWPNSLASDFLTGWWVLWKKRKQIQTRWGEDRDHPPTLHTYFQQWLRAACFGRWTLIL